MPLTEQQAVAWAGRNTAEMLTVTARSQRPDGRLTPKVCRDMLHLSTEVVHCITPPNGQTPLFAIPFDQQGFVPEWCSASLARDAKKEETLKGLAKRTSFANKNKAQDEPFFLSYGYEKDIGHHNQQVPLLRVSSVLTLPGAHPELTSLRLSDYV